MGFLRQRSALFAVCALSLAGPLSGNAEISVAPGHSWEVFATDVREIDVFAWVPGRTDVLFVTSESPYPYGGLTLVNMATRAVDNDYLNGMARGDGIEYSAHFGKFVICEEMQPQEIGNGVSFVDPWTRQVTPIPNTNTIRRPDTATVDSYTDPQNPVMYISESVPDGGIFRLSGIGTTHTLTRWHFPMFTPESMVIDPQTRFMYVTETHNNRVLRFALPNSTPQTFVAPADMIEADGLWLDQDDRVLYVGEDHNPGKVWRVPLDNPAGAEVIASGLNLVQGIITHPETGDIFVAEQGTWRIIRIFEDGGTGGDVTPPQPVLSSPNLSITNDPLDLLIEYSEPVTGFTSTDVSVTNGTVTDFDGLNALYTAQVVPTVTEGTVQVTVPQGVAEDAAGNLNVASDPLTRTYDAVAPEVEAITRVGSTPTSESPVEFLVSFTEAVQASGDVLLNFEAVTTGSLTGAQVIGVTGLATSILTVSVGTGSGEGDLRLDFTDADTLVDGAGNPTAGTFTTGESYQVIQSGLTVQVASTAPNPTNAMVPVTFTFSESVTNFTASDLTVSNATVSGFTGTGAVYTATLNPVGQGAVTVAVPAGVAQNSGGDGNAASQTLTRNFDSVPPTAQSIKRGDTTPTRATSVSFVVTFSEPVTGAGSLNSRFTPTTTGTLSGVSVASVSGSGKATLTVNVNTGTGSGNLGLSFIDNDVLRDLAGNPVGGVGNGNGSLTTSETYVIDRIRPTVTLTTTATTNPTNAPIPVRVTFSEPVTGFTATTTDLYGINATATNFSGSGAVYNFTVVPPAQGSVSGMVRDGAAVDAAGNANVTSGMSSIGYDSVFPRVSSIIPANPSPTGAASVSFTVTFSENVTGVDSADFTLTRSGTLAATSVTGVTGTGSTRTVTVNTGTGSGTLRLNVTDNDTIRDAATNRLGGPGTGNGNYTAGTSYTIQR